MSLGCKYMTKLVTSHLTEELKLETKHKYSNKRKLNLILKMQIWSRLKNIKEPWLLFSIERISKSHYIKTIQAIFRAIQFMRFSWLDSSACRLNKVLVEFMRA